VEIVTVLGQQKETRLACLGPGQFFGEVELMLGGNSIAQVRSGSQGVELAHLPRETFYELIDDSPLTRSRIQEVAAARLAENDQRKNNR